MATTDTASATDEDTQTQTQGSQLDWGPGSVPAIPPIIWGRLYFAQNFHSKQTVKTDRALPEYIDLVKGDFRLGRSLNSDYAIKRDTVKDEILKNISKQHFVIRRDITKSLNPAFIVDESYNGTFVNGEKVGRGKKKLLDDGDAISITHPHLRVCVYKDLMKNDQGVVCEDVASKYYISRTLGQGACGVVKLVYHKETGAKYAMKIIKTNTTLKSVNVNRLNDEQKIRNEINILKSVTHPNIVKTYEVLESGNDVYIVMELLEGGELFERVTRLGRLPELATQVIMRQIVLAVLHLHDLGITHRDLKLENVLLESASLDSVVKITDFGLSKCMGEEGFMKTVCGTPLYIAPELLTGKKYGAEVDVWSLGVMLFVCLSGYMPFSPDYGTPLTEQIRLGKYKYSVVHWKGVSSMARALVKDMLRPSPLHRIKLRDMLKHPWLQNKVVIGRVEQLLSHSAQVDSLSQLSVESDQENKSPCLPVKCKRLFSGATDTSPAAKRHRLGLVRTTPARLSDQTTSSESVNTNLSETLKNVDASETTSIANDT